MFFGTWALFLLDMVRDYTYYSYRPDYGFELYKENKLVDSEKVVAGAACFSRVFRDLEKGPNTLEYKGIYTIRCRKKFEKGSGNFCALDKSEVLRILRYMKDSLNVDISMEDTPDNYIFHMNIEGKPIKHKFALTFLRVFYEFPYNEFAKEAFRLRDNDLIPGLKHMSFLKIFFIICTSFQQHDHGGHSLFCQRPRNLSIKILRQAYEEGRDRVQQVYNGKSIKYKQVKCGWGEFHCLDWEASVEDRLKIYSDNFKLLRNEKGIRRRVRKAVRKLD